MEEADTKSQLPNNEVKLKEDNQLTPTGVEAIDDKDQEAMLSNSNESGLKALQDVSVVIPKPEVSQQIECAISNPDLIKSTNSTPLVSPCPRRSSSRSIKRPKFDDELVETSAFKRILSRKTSECSPSEVKSKKVKLLLFCFLRFFLFQLRFFC